MSNEEKIEILIDMCFEAWQDSSVFDQQKIRELAEKVLKQISQE